MIIHFFKILMTKVIQHNFLTLFSNIFKYFALKPTGGYILKIWQPCLYSGARQVPKKLSLLSKYSVAISFY